MHWNKEDLEQEIDELIADIADISWQTSGYRPGNHVDGRKTYDCYKYAPRKLIIYTESVFGGTAEDPLFSSVRAMDIKEVAWCYAERYAEMKEEEIERRGPDVESVAAASVWMGLLYENSKMTQAGIGEVAGVHSSTVSEHVNEMFDEFKGEVDEEILGYEKPR